MHFASPSLLWLLLLVPVMAILLFLNRKKRLSAMNRFIALGLQNTMLCNDIPLNRWIKSVCLLITLTLIILASARPQWGKKLQISEEKALDIVVAIDVSKSMLAEDLPPNRIERAKNAFTHFLDQLNGGDRVGLVIFSGDSFVQCPLTNDYSAVKMFVSMIEVGILPHEGTNIAAAMNRSLQLFSEESPSKVMILITDGEHLQGEYNASIKNAQKKGVVVYTLGVGTAQGAPIPIVDEQTQESEYLKDRNGQIVLTKLDTKTLQLIAQETHGGFFQIAAGMNQMRKILTDINLMERDKLATRQFSQYKERYYYFLIPALCLLLLCALLWERRKS